MSFPFAAAAGLLLAALGPVPSAGAQRPGCGFGAALEALGTAERSLRRAQPGVGSLAEGRALAAAVSERMRQGTEGLAACGCRRAATESADAAILAERALSETSVPALGTALEQARFRLSLARQRLDRDGCA